MKNIRKIALIKFYTAKEEVIEVTEMGDLEFEVEVEGRIDTITLHDVCIAPIKDSFISVAQLVEKGVTFEFATNSCTLRKDGEVVLVAKKFERLYYVPLHNAEVVAAALPTPSGTSGQVTEGHVPTATLSQPSNPTPSHPYALPDNTTFPPTNPTHNLNSEALNELMRNHIQLGHANADIIKKAAKCKSIEGLSDEIIHQTLEKCPICMEGKSEAQNKNPTSEDRPTEVLARVHFDRSGPHTPTLGGNTSYQLGVDAASIFLHIDLGKDKSEGPRKIQEFVEKAEKQTSKSVRAIRTDGAAEYNSKAYKDWLAKKGITKETSAPYCQSQNGLAERNIQTINNMATCMLLQAGLKPPYWGYAVTYAAFIRNVLPTKRSEKSPYEQWFGKKPNMQMVHTFGCEAWAHIPKQRRKKFVGKATRCIFLGVADNYEAFVLCRVSDRKQIISRDVSFRENVFPAKHDGPHERDQNAEVRVSLSLTPPNMVNTNTSPPPFPNLVGPNVSLPISADTPNLGTGEHIPNQDVTQNMENIPNSSIFDNISVSDTTITQDDISDIDDPLEEFDDSSVAGETQTLDPPITSNLESQPTVRRSSRVPKLNPKYYANTLQSSEAEPTNYWQAVSPQFHDKWITPIQEEYDAQIKNGTWEIVPRSSVPPGHKLHRPIWRFKIKSDGRHKARLCFDGRFQQYGFDYHETTSPVARLESVRSIIALTLKMGGKIEQGDVPNAFLNSPIDTDVFMYQPEGFEQGDGVCKLKKGLYGLKQASKLWYEEMDQYITTHLKAKRHQLDQCVYSRKITDGFFYIVVYVDDVLVCSNSQKAIDVTFAALKAQFKIKRMGPLSEYLGMKCEWINDGRSVHISQPIAIAKMLERFDLQQCRPTKSPHNPKHMIAKNDTRQTCDITTYRSAIGALLWIMRCSRPDIAFIVGLLSQHQSNPSHEHMGAVKHVMRYLAGTATYGIVVNPPISAHTNYVHVHSDSSFADPQIALRSTSGCMIEIAGSLVSWFSRKQSLHAMSSAEAEYIAAAEAVKEGIWTMNFIQCLRDTMTVEIVKEFLLMIDSSSCISMIKRGYPDRGRTRHIELQSHMILDHYREGVYGIEWIGGDQNIADLLTKSIPSLRHFMYLRDRVVIDVRGSNGRQLETTSSATRV